MTAALAFASLAVIGGPVQEVPVVWTGARSKIARPDVRLVTDEWRWMGLWMRHRGDLKNLKWWEKADRDPQATRRYSYYNEGDVPLVDFRTHAVLAVFGGTANQTAGYTLVSCERTGAVLTLRYVPRFYSVFVTGKSERRQPDQPFAFFLLEQGFSELRVEKALVESKDRPPTKFVTVKVFKV